jgi:hypothetical protein
VSCSEVASRLPGRALRSLNVRALLIWVSLQFAALMIALGTPLMKRRRHAASAASFRNDLIIADHNASL